MTYFEAKVQIETDESLNQVNSKILSALFAADIDAAGVQVEEFETKPLFDVADLDFVPSQEDYVPHPQLRKHASELYMVEAPADRPVAVGDTVRVLGHSIPEGSATADLIAALKSNGDRYHG